MPSRGRTTSVWYATMYGWEMVWPRPIGSGRFSYAALISPGGTNS